MFFRYNLLLSVFLGSALCASGQNPGQIQILSQKEQKPLAGAFVVLKSLHKGPGSHAEQYLFANENGMVLNTSKDTVHVFISCIGYNAQEDTLLPGNGHIYFLTEHNSELDPVVVTGQYDYTTSDQSVYNITVISAKTIQQRGAQNLNDLLQNELGMKLGQDNILGSSVSINGVGGQHVKILIDGVPVIGRENGNIDISQINLNDIDHVEIVEGPMSVSYGTDALGGAINLITKKKLSHPVEASLNGHYETVGTWNFDGSLSLMKKHFSASVNAGRYFFAGFNPVDTGRFTEWKPKEQYFAGLSLGWKSKNVENTWKSYGMYQLTLNKGAMVLTPYQAYAFDDYYYTRRWNESLFTEAHLKNHASLSFTNSYAWYNRIKNTYRKDLVTMDNLLLGDQTAQDTSTFHDFLFRGTYSTALPSHRMNYQAGYDITLETGIGNQLKNRKQSINDFALFGSLEYKPSSHLFLRPGLRFSYNTRYGAPVIPSFNLKYDLGEKYSFRASYARGFRAPSLKELNLLFVDANHNIRGNDSLQAEKSNNLTAGFSYLTNFQNDVLKLGLNAFYNDIRNIIELGLIDAATQYYSYINVSRYRCTGFNFNAELKGERFSFQTGFSFTGTYNSFSDTLPVDKYLITPEFRNNFTLHFAKIHLDACVFFKSTGTTPGFAFDASGKLIQTFTQPFNIVDITFNKSFFQNHCSVAGGIRNLFNVINITTNSLSGDFHSDDSGFVPYSIGRFFFLTLSYKFFKK